MGRPRKGRKPQRKPRPFRASARPSSTRKDRPGKTSSVKRSRSAKPSRPRPAKAPYRGVPTRKKAPARKPAPPAPRPAAKARKLAPPAPRPAAKARKPAPPKTIIRGPKLPAPGEKLRFASRPKVKPRNLATELERVYRDRQGRVVPKGTKGATPTTIIWEIDETKGKRLRVVSYVTPDHAEKIAPIPVEGEDMGRIDAALINSSATAEFRDAAMVDFVIRAKDQRGKSHRFKVTFNLGEVRRRRKLYGAVVGRILQELRRRGFRSNYTLELFRQARLRGLKYRIAWNEWRKLDVLKDMEIFITIYK